MKLCFQKSFFRFTTLKASITIFLFLCRATVVASARGFSGEGGNGGQSAGKERKGLKYLLYLYLLQIVGYQHNCLFGSYRLSFEQNVLNLFVLDAIFLASLFPSRRRRPANEGGNATGKGENSRAREKREKEKEEEERVECTDFGSCCQTKLAKAKLESPRVKTEKGDNLGSGLLPGRPTLIKYHVNSLLFYQSTICTVSCACVTCRKWTR